jgi:long-chain acyl-CoA synthetase
MDAEISDETAFSWREITEAGKVLIENGNREFLDAQIERDVMSIILFTSGTTGIAKGVMLSHGNIVEDLMASPTLLKVVPEDVFFSVLPIHHTYECTCGFLMPLYRGASVAYCEGLKYIVKNLSEAKPTIFLGVPLIFEGLYKRYGRTPKNPAKRDPQKSN